VCYTYPCDAEKYAMKPQYKRKYIYEEYVHKEDVLVDMEDLGLTRCVHDYGYVSKYSNWSGCYNEKPGWRVEYEKKYETNGSPFKHAMKQKASTL
jgi:hypothetical protein